MYFTLSKTEKNIIRVTLAEILRCNILDIQKDVGKYFIFRTFKDPVTKNEISICVIYKSVYTIVNIIGLKNLEKMSLYWKNYQAMEKNYQEELHVAKYFREWPWAKINVQRGVFKNLYQVQDSWNFFPPVRDYLNNMNSKM